MRSSICSVPPSSVVFRGDLYPRDDADPALVQRYAAALEAGETLPPITCAEHGGLILLDGLHRLRAHLLRHMEAIEVDVVDVPPERFFLAAVVANARHGSALTAGERILAIHRLNDEGYAVEQIASAVAMPVNAVRPFLIRAATRPPAAAASAPLRPPAPRPVATVPFRSGTRAYDAIEDALARLGDVVRDARSLERLSLGEIEGWLTRVEGIAASLRPIVERRRLAAGGTR